MFSTLYTATDALGAFIEVLPYYRRSPSDFRERLYAETAEDTPDLEVDYADGDVKPDFFTRRVLGRAKVRDGARFVDADDPRTHAELNRQLPQLLQDHGLAEFDRGVVMSQDRRITRQLAGHLHELYADSEVVGIRYESRRYHARECFAIWETPGLLHGIDPDPIVPAIPELRRAAELLDITLPSF